MSNCKYAVFQTNEIAFLISCIETGSYGESEGDFRARDYDNIRNLRDIKIGDRVFLRFKDKIISGPFIISEPHRHFVIKDSYGCWHRVNINKTPTEYHPNWLSIKPWCFFFDLTLASQVNYCEFGRLPSQFKNIPRIDFIDSNLGEDLWNYLEDNGNSFADFLQRQPKNIRYRFPCTVSVHRRTNNNVLTGRYKTKTGAWVRSKSEKLIADSLHDHGYRFEYEKILPLGDKIVHPDFFLTDHNLIIEHLGLLGASIEYEKDWEWKKNLYDNEKLTYIILKEEDMKELDKNLLFKLSQKIKRT